MTEQEIIHKLRTDKQARKTYLANLKAKYQEYRAEGGDQPALKWALDFLGPDIWNELFAYKNSSYGVPTVLLERRGGRFVAVRAK